MATIKYWDGSAWQYAVVGKQGPVGPTGPTGPAGQASLQRFRYVATGGQTSVSGTDANGNTLAYTPGLEEVFINGAAQVRGQDYTATNGTSITGITALIAGDVVEIYAWGVFNVANTISNTLIDAKGDILAGTGADSVGRLAVGANDTVLTADSSTATGLKWAAPAAGGFTELASGNLPTNASTITLSNISGSYVDLRLYIRGARCSTAGCSIQIRFNGDTNTNYYSANANAAGQGLASASFANLWQTGYSQNTETDGLIVFDVMNYASTTTNKIIGNAFSTYNSIGASPTEWNLLDRRGLWKNTAAITSLTILENDGKNFSAGSYILYGVK